MVYIYIKSKNRLQIILITILFVLYWQPTFHLLMALVVGYIKYLGRLYYYSNRDTLYFGKQLSLSYIRILCYQYLPNYILVGPSPIYKYSLFYTFFFSFLLPYKSQRCSNTPPQSLLRDLLVNIAIQTASDKETGKREDRKDREAFSKYQSSNINSYIMAT